MKKCKFAILIFGVLNMIFLQCGCWDKTEIDRLGIVKAISISKSNKSKFLIVSVEVTNYYNYNGGSGNMNNNLKDNSQTIISGRGKTFIQALNNIQEHYNKKLNFSHNKIVIFDKKYVKSGITNILDTFERSNIIRYGTYVIVSESSPIKVLKSKYNSEERQMSAIEMLLKLNSDAAVNCPVRWYTFLLNLKSDSHVATIPIIKINKKSEMSISTVAVFKNDKMIGALSSNQTKMFQWILNNAKDQNIDFPFNNKGAKGIVSFRVAKEDCNLKVIKSMKAKYGIKVNITCNGSASLKAYTDSTLHLIDKNFMNVIQMQANLYLKKNFINLIRCAKYSLHADIVGFGNEINNTMPNEWNKLKKDWERKFKSIDYDVNFNIKFKDIGIIKDTIGN